MRHVTGTDRARRLKLSPCTIPRALYDHPDIGGQTMERVMSIAAGTNCRPTLIARSLQIRRSSTIGVNVPEIGTTAVSILPGMMSGAALKNGRTTAEPRGGTITLKTRLMVREST